MKYLITIILLLSTPLAFSQSKEEFFEATSLVSKVIFKTSSDTLVSSFSTTAFAKEGDFGTTGLLHCSTMKWRVEITSDVNKEDLEGDSIITIKIYDLNSVKSKDHKAELIFSTDLRHKGFGTYFVLTMNGAKLELSIEKPKETTRGKDKKASK